MKPSLLLLLLWLLNACTDAPSQFTAESYAAKLAQYSCSRLETEKNFQEKIKSELTQGKKDLSVADDVAVGVLLTWGTETLGSDRSNTTSGNYDAGIALAEEKLTIIETERERCVNA